MLQHAKDAKYADIMELELDNGFLGGIGLDGESWFYRNSLRVHADSSDLAGGHNFMTVRGQPGRKQLCCPTNLLRTIAQLHTYLYNIDNEGIWVHHYAGNVFEGKLADGSQLKLTQETNYPWDGRVVLTIDAVASTQPVAIRVRIPGWAENAVVRINGAPTANAPTPGQYLSMETVWKAGDRIDMDLPMPDRLMQAHPKAEQLRNQVAVTRGPVLYCVESVDLPDDVDMNNVYVPSDIQLSPKPAEDLPFGITALDGDALYQPATPWEGELYRPLTPATLRSLPIRMTPYFAWCNRGPTAMNVWLPIVWSK